MSVGVDDCGGEVGVAEIVRIFTERIYILNINKKDLRTHGDRVGALEIT